MMVGTVTEQEWPWVLTRSLANGWTQMDPEIQGHTQAVASRLQEMLRYSVSVPGAATLVARNGTQPVGYLIVTIVPDELTGMPTGLFFDIWVEPDWRGKGVAALLTATGEQYLRSIGIRHVRRVIAAQNGPSIRRAHADGYRVERLIYLKKL